MDWKRLLQVHPLAHLSTSAGAYLLKEGFSVLAAKIHDRNLYQSLYPDLTYRSPADSADSADSVAQLSDALRQGVDACVREERSAVRAEMCDTSASASALEVTASCLLMS
jgi:hypothetical protein